MKPPGTTILHEIVAALAAEERVMLATIVSAKGSTPAAASSRLLLRNAGTLPVGTIGGGCMEGEVIHHARRLFASGGSEIVTYNLNEDEAGQGLNCGGTVDVLIAPVTRRDLPVYEDLVSLYENGEDALVATHIDGSGTLVGRAITHPSSVPPPARWTRPGELFGLGSSLPADIGLTAAAVHRTKETVRVPFAGGAILLEACIAAPRLVIYGGGHVGRALSRCAAAVGFRVCVADDRAKYASPERFADAAEARVIDYRDAVAPLDIRDSTYVAIVTRGHAFDEEVLGQVLGTPARYVGMIGSKRKILAAMRRLHELGVPLDALKRVHAPIGIEIAAVTAEEIAVSIVAQLINIRRGGAMTIHYKSDDLRTLLQDLGPQPLIAS